MVGFLTKKPVFKTKTIFIANFLGKLTVNLLYHAPKIILSIVID